MVGTTYFWDHGDCPRDECDGELEQQDRFNVMCLSCESVWGHAKMGDKHYLQTEDFETVAEKPVTATDGGRVDDATERDGELIEVKEDFEPPSDLDQEYEETIRQTVKTLSDGEDRPEGFHISLHRGDGVGFTTGMSYELVSDVGPTLPAVEMLAEHLSTVHQQTQGMEIDELALLAARHVKKWDDEGQDKS